MNAMLCCAVVGVEAAEGDVRLHQKPPPGGRRPLRQAVRANVDLGRDQPPGRDHPEPSPLAGLHPTTPVGSSISFNSSAEEGERGDKTREEKTTREA